MFLHDFLARVYDTRERKGVRGFALFGNSNTVLYACGPCRWGNVQDRLGCPARMFSHFIEMIYVYSFTGALYAGFL